HPAGPHLEVGGSALQRREGTDRSGNWPAARTGLPSIDGEMEERHGDGDGEPDQLVPATAHPPEAQRHDGEAYRRRGGGGGRPGGWRGRRGGRGPAGPWQSPTRKQASTSRPGTRWWSESNRWRRAPSVRRWSPVWAGSAGSSLSPQESTASRCWSRV